MILNHHKEFSKNYKKRIAGNSKLVDQFKKQLARFVINPADPILKDHKLTGKKKNFRAFSITGDVRLVYTVVNNEIWLYDIGTHNQVY